jgi:hypothetical protein
VFERGDTRDVEEMNDRGTMPGKVETYCCRVTNSTGIIVRKSGIMLRSNRVACKGHQ